MCVCVSLPKTFTRRGGLELDIASERIGIILSLACAFVASTFGVLAKKNFHFSQNILFSSKNIRVS